MATLVFSITTTIFFAAAAAGASPDTHVGWPRLAAAGSSEVVAATEDESFNLPCERRPLAAGHFVKREGSRLVLGGAGAGAGADAGGGDGSSSDQHEFRFVSVNVPMINRIELDCIGDFPSNDTRIETKAQCARLMASDGWWQANDQGQQKGVLVPTQSEIADQVCTVQRLGGQVARAFALSLGDNLVEDDSLPTKLKLPTGATGSRFNDVRGESFHVTFDPARVTDAAHPERGLVFHEHWYTALDRVLVTAREAGVRMLLPFVHADYSTLYGGLPYVSRWAEAAGAGPFQQKGGGGGGGGGGGNSSGNHTPSSSVYNSTEAQFATAFYTGAGPKALYREVVRHLVTRVNTIDGTKYSEDPAIFGWELGVELYDTAVWNDPQWALRDNMRWLPRVRRASPPPAAWTHDMALFVKSLDPNHLIVDGGIAVRPSAAVEDAADPDTEDYTDNISAKRLKAAEVAALDAWPVDVVGGTYYGANAMDLFKRDLVVAAGPGGCGTRGAAATTLLAFFSA